MSITKRLFGGTCTYCKEKKTKRKSLEGEYICSDCQLELDKNKEQKVKCPECSTIMSKKIVADIVIDKCRECGGVYLNSGELEALSNFSSDDSANFTTGMYIGTIIN